MTADAPRILVVDDEEDNCHNLLDILNDLGWRVEIATDGRSALELARRTSFDVALLDLRMPGMDGLTLCRELKALRSETVAIVLTAYAAAATEHDALAAGAWRLLSKPVDLASLFRLVDEATGWPLVLLVDDDRDLCASIADILSQRGFRAATAHDGEEAAARLREARYRVVLIDMKLPKGSGDEVFRLVRRVDPAARTVVITGYRAETNAQIEDVLREGVDAVWYKPFAMPDLLSALRALADQGAEA